MMLLFAAHFSRSYRKAPREIRQAFDKQSMLLLLNLRQPSLLAKKYMTRAKTSGKPGSQVTGASISA